MEDVAKRVLGPNATESDIDDFWVAHFQDCYFSGTSIGGIIMLLLLMGYKVSELRRELNQDVLKNIFWANSLNPLNLLNSYKYNNTYLRVEMLKLMKKKNFSETDTFSSISQLQKDNKVFFSVNSYCLSTNTCVFWNSEKHQNLPIIDAMLMTSAAPSYFPTYWYQGKEFCDGGIYANNPSLMLLNYLYERDTTSVRECLLINIGTGFFQETVTQPMLYFSWAYRAVTLIMNSDVLKTKNLLETLQRTQTLRYLYCDIKLKEEICLDEKDYDKLMKEYDMAEKMWTKHLESLLALNANESKNIVNSHDEIVLGASPSDSHEKHDHKQHHHQVNLFERISHQ